jgi:hypothetical protein
MRIASSIRSVPFADFLTFECSELKIFAVVAGETLVLGATFFVGEPPFLPIPVSNNASLLVSGLLATALAAVLYVLLSGLGYQTYSPPFHNPVHILKCWVAYLMFSTVIIYIGYLLLVYPYTQSLVPMAVDIGIGAVLSTAYAISIASVIYGEGFFSDSTNSKSEALNQFLTAAENLKQKPRSDIVNEPNELIQAGELLLTGFQASDLQGTEELASDLQDWLKTFKQRELQGQKKMVGDLHNNNTQFTVWEERYRTFQQLKEKLKEMDSSAICKVLL